MVENERETYVVGDDHAAFPRYVLGEKLRLLKQARANVNGIGAITQADIHGNHAFGVCRGGCHAERGGAGRHAFGVCRGGCHAERGGAGRVADGGGGGEEERMDEGGEEAEQEEERKGGEICDRHWVPASCERVATCCMHEV